MNPEFFKILHSIVLKNHKLKWNSIEYLLLVKNVQLDRTQLVQITVNSITILP